MIRLRDRRPRAILLVLLQASLATLLVIAGAWTDRGSRAAGPEGPVATYALALARSDLEGALDQLAPELRSRAAPFVAWQLGNRYDLLDSAVVGPSALDRLAGGGAVLPRVAVTVDVLAEDGTRWRVTEDLPVEQIGGRWYLSKVPLEPTEE